MTDDADSTLERELARTALGDRAAFRRVFELTHRHLLGVAVRVLGRHDLGEEVLQEVYVAVWQRAAGWRGDARPMAWLVALVRHRAIDLLRSRAGSALERQAEALDETLPAQAADTLGRALAGAHVAPCMDSLAGPQRQSLALAFYNGLSHAEVAQHLAVPLGSVKTWIHRGLAQLRRCLEGQAGQAA